MIRPTITPEECDAALAAVPAPAGTAWYWDASADSDRLRLFWEPPRKGEICIAYPDGTWCVDDPGGGYAFISTGKVADLHAAMRMALLVARESGWQPFLTEAEER